MSKERFEIFGDKLVKDNAQTPNLLNNYLCCVRLNEFTDKIADLEAKLAESERENRDLHTSINLSIPNQIAMRDEIERLHTCRDKMISELLEENEQLKQQLAEKEKESLVYFNEYRAWKNMYELLKKDKTDFAIEQLEFLRSEIKMMGHIPNYTVLPEKELICRYDVFRLIDQQIKELKGKNV